MTASACRLCGAAVSDEGICPACLVDEYGYDDEGRYVGPCETCGTSHRGTNGPGTLGGEHECIRARIVAIDPDHPFITTMDARWDQAQAAMREATMRVLSDMGFEVPRG